MNLVIMNPPLTRDSLRHDQFSCAHELVIKRRGKEILEGQIHACATRLAGERAKWDFQGQPFADCRSRRWFAVLLKAWLPKELRCH